MENNSKRFVGTFYSFALILGLTIFHTSSIFGQVVIGGSERSNSAMLEIKGSDDGGLTYKGLMPPRVPTLVLRDAMNPSLNDIGMMIFVSEIACLQIYNGVSWESINCLGAVTNTVVNFSQQNITAGESIGSLDFDFLITNPSSTATIDVTIAILEGYDDVVETAPQTFTIPMNVSSYAEPALFNVLDDTIMESDETLTFIISIVTGGTSATIGATNTDTVTITDNDSLFTPFSESFETDGSGTRYTLSAAENADPNSNGDDYFIRTDGSDIIYPGNNSVDFIGSPDGTHYFAVQDIDGITGNPIGIEPTMQFNGIDINSGVNLQLDILLAEDDEGTSQHWDSGDSFIIEYQIDGGGYQNLFAIRSPSTFNGEPMVDTDFDGVGDGNVVTSTWDNFNAVITGTGLILDLRITFNLNSDDEDIAIDNIRITSN